MSQDYCINPKQSNCGKCRYNERCMYVPIESWPEKYVKYQHQLFKEGTKEYLKGLKRDGWSITNMSLVGDFIEDHFTRMVRYAFLLSILSLLTSSLLLLTTILRVIK